MRHGQSDIVDDATEFLRYLFSVDDFDPRTIDSSILQKQPESLGTVFQIRRAVPSLHYLVPIGQVSLVIVEALCSMVNGKTCGSDICRIVPKDSCIELARTHNLNEGPKKEGNKAR